MWLECNLGVALHVTSTQGLHEAALLLQLLHSEGRTDLRWVQVCVWINIIEHAMHNPAHVAHTTSLPYHE